MKKVSALLLTAVLGSSMVFAGIGGSVTATYGYYLDTQKAGFTNANDIEADFSFSTEDSIISEGDIHAEITASLVIKVEELTGGSAEVKFVVDDDDLSAKIVGPNWYVDIKGADDLADYAKDFASNDDGDEYHNYEFASSEIDGLTVGYTYEEGKTVVVAFGSDLDFDNTDATDYLAVASPAYMLAEGLTAEFAVALQNVNKKFDFGGGMKLAFAADDYSLTAAVDMGYMAARDAVAGVTAVTAVAEHYEIDQVSTSGTYGQNVKILAVTGVTGVDAVTAADAKFDIEAAVTGTYSLATIEAYFATNVGIANDGDEVDYTFDGKAGENLLSVKLTADLDEVVENVPVTVYAQFSSKDAADSRMNAGADYTLALEEASLAVGIETGLVLDTDDWMIGADVEYTPANNAYVAKASVKYLNYNTVGGLATVGKAIQPSVSVETTTLVNGATLTAEYTDATISLEDNGVSIKGLLKATCEISF